MGNLPRVINVSDGEKDPEIRDQKKKKLFVTLKMKIVQIVYKVKNKNSKIIHFTSSREYLHAILVCYYA